MEQLRQRVIASCHLGPLKEEETKHYINYRLQEAGWSGGNLFDDNALMLIYRLTEGVPRRINVFCDRILLFGYLEEISFFTSEHVKIVAEELSEEITSPLVLQNKDDVARLINTEQQKYEHALSEQQSINNQAETFSSNIPDEPVIPQAAPKAPEPVQHKVEKPVAMASGTTEFVDIEETIKDFESRVEQEIASFKRSLDKNT